MSAHSEASQTGILLNALHKRLTITERDGDLFITLFISEFGEFLEPVHERA